MSNPVETLAASLYGATLKDLLPVEHDEWRFTAENNRTKKERTGKLISRRPYPEHCRIDMFEQSWGSTALGFGGIGGASITSAYTVIVTGPNGDACVYFAGRLAYHIKRPNQKFWEDNQNRSMRPVSGARVYEQPTEQGGV